MEYAIGSTKWAGLSKLVEEMGEVAQVVGKIIGANGAVQHWDGSNLPNRLIEELGDLRAAIQFVVEQNLGPETMALIEKRAEQKLAKFREWHHETTQMRPVATGTRWGVWCTNPSAGVSGWLKSGIATLWVGTEDEAYATAVRGPNGPEWEHEAMPYVAGGPLDWAARLQAARERMAKQTKECAQ